MGIEHSLKVIALDHHRMMARTFWDGSENVAKKNDFPFFQLSRVYLEPLNMSNAGNFWDLTDSGSKRRRKFRRRMSTSSIKSQIRRFLVLIMQWTSKKCTKKRGAREELMFWSLNLLFSEAVVSSSS